MTQVQRNLANIAERLEKIDETVATLESRLEEQEAAVEYAREDLDTAIEEWKPLWEEYKASLEETAHWDLFGGLYVPILRHGSDDEFDIQSLDPDILFTPEGNMPDFSPVVHASAELTLALTLYDKTEREIGWLEIEKANLELRQSELQTLLNNLENDERSIWCADLSTNFPASGMVQTMEIKGEPSHIMVVPRSPGHSTLDAGQLSPIMGMSSPQAALNFAVHPGWQKWMPTHRIGIITDINYSRHTASVDMDNTVSHYQGLPINQSESLSGVPIWYMNCRSMPFEVGDRVVVEFQGQSQASPRIIGFETWPRTCCTPGIAGSFVTIEVIENPDPGGVDSWQPITVDLTPWQNEGRVEFPHRHPRWRIIWRDRQMTVNGECCYCYQFSRGRVNSRGRLVGLPDEMLIPAGWFPHSYPNMLHIEICCRPFADEHGPGYFWPTPSGKDGPCACEPHPESWWLFLPEEERHWYWMEDQEWYSDL